MKAYIIICAIVILSSIIFAIINYNFWKKTEEKQILQIKEDRTNEIYNELKSQVKEKISSEVTRLQQVQSSINNAYSNLRQINNEISTKKTFNNNLLKIREEELNRLIEEKRKEKIDRLEREVDDWAQSAQEAATENFHLFAQGIGKRMIDMENTYQSLKDEVEDFQKKRKVINQEILRQRIIEERQDFYRIQLSEESIRDISILEEIKPRLSKLDSLNKLIYDNYIKKPAEEMIKRVLEGRAPCGIYKITRLKTGEIYIGKSTDVKARWSQHTKSAFHCGTISHSVLHTTMEKDGINGFTWELLEEVPKDKLTEREKYWIQFYGSQKYGLNEKAG